MTFFLLTEVVLYFTVVLLLGVHTRNGLIISVHDEFLIDYARAQSTYFFKSSALTTPSPVISNLLKAFSTIFKASLVKGSYKQATRGFEKNMSNKKYPSGVSSQTDNFSEDFANEICQVFQGFLKSNSPNKIHPSTTEDR